jgi:hypothetical protein
VKPIEITKEQFLAFEAVRLSGVTNMTAIEDIEELSGLTQQQIQAIIKFHDELKRKYVTRE